jgi:drug/metabolite transporter (DMT)-like permease
MSRQTRAILLALSGILFWSTMATAFKLSLRELNFASLLLYSTAFSLLALAIVISVQRKWSELMRQSRREWLHSLLMGALNPALYYFILFRAYELLPAQEALVLNYTWPVMLILLSIPLLGQRLGWLQGLAVLLSFAGILVIGTQGRLATLQFSHLTGDLMAMGSSVIWALFWIYNVRSGADPVVKLFMNFVPGFLLVLIISLLLGFPLQLPDVGSLLATAYIGFFEMGITFVVWLMALKSARNTQSVSQLVFLSPFLSLLWISLFVGEKIHPATLIGLLLIVVGILLGQLKRSR